MTIPKRLEGWGNAAVNVGEGLAAGVAVFGGVSQEQFVSLRVEAADIQPT
jgi:hypothetical protein